MRVIFSALEVLAFLLIAVAPASQAAGGCTDADRDGFCVRDDCDDSNPNCTTDCTDSDGDGFCVTSDCDDSSANGNDCNANGSPDDCDTRVRFEAHALPSFFASTSSFFPDDVDGDGDQDFLYSATSSPGLALYRNSDGQGDFSASSLAAAFPYPTEIVAGDMDGDGDHDVISVTDDGVNWNENLGAGAFGPKRVIGTGFQQGISVDAADIDGDGDLDVFVAFKSSNLVGWYRNDDGLGGAFTGLFRFGTHNGPEAVRGADLDGDGDTDAVVATGFGDKIAWYENSAGGTVWFPHVVSVAVNHPVSVEAVDVDLDGDLDLVAGVLLDSDVYWYENVDGAGSFGPERFVADAGTPFGLFEADIDNDGAPDVVMTSSGEIRWAPNLDGLGSFGGSLLVGGDYAVALDVIAADFDGDGDLDVVSGDAEFITVDWYENLRDDCNNNTVPDSCETVSPDAAEINDGLDNQCFGDAGFGLVDEISGPAGFFDPNDKNKFYWQAQTGATSYQVARAGTPDFTSACTLFSPTLGTLLIDPALPASGGVLHYLVRAAGPNVGSWGQRSDGVERDVPCD